MHLCQVARNASAPCTAARQPRPARQPHCQPSLPRTTGATAACANCPPRTSRVLCVTCVLGVQAATGAGLSAGVIEIADGVDLVMRTPVAMADLRRLKRAYVKVATSGTCWDKSAVDGTNAARAFVAYLLENLPGAERG